jgi:tetratricopeptide (TPR) repeat protein
MKENWPFAFPWRRLDSRAPFTLTGAVLTVLAGALLAGPLQAQVAPFDRTVDIYVRVYDARTEYPLERVRLELLRFPDGVMTQLFSDSSGRQTFPRLLPNSYVIRASLPGYQTAEVRLDIRRGDVSREVGVPMDPLVRAPSVGPGSISTRSLQIPEGALREFSRGLTQLKEKKDPKRSVQYFQRAVEISPEYYESYFMMGMAYLQMKAQVKAETAFRKAIELNPHFLEPYYPLSVLLIAARKHAEAEVLLREALKMDPEGWRWPFELARSCANRDDWRSALEYALMARAQPGAPPKVHILLADLYSAIGERAKAIEELEKFAQLEPQSPMMPRVQQALLRLRDPG